VWKLCVFCGKKAAFRGFFNAFRDLNYGLLWIHSLFGFCLVSRTKAPGKNSGRDFPLRQKSRNIEYSMLLIHWCSDIAADFESAGCRIGFSPLCTGIGEPPGTGIRAKDGGGR
jgi:hypothetical protein